MCVAAECRKAWGLISGTPASRAALCTMSRAMRWSIRPPRAPRNRALAARDLTASVAVRASTGRPCSSQVSSARWAGSPNGTTRCLLPLPVTLMVRLEKSMSAISIDTSSATRMPVAYSSSRIAALRCDSAVTRALSRLSARAGASLRFTVSADLSAVLPAALPLPGAAAAPPSSLYWFVATACSATSNNCSAWDSVSTAGSVLGIEGVISVAAGSVVVSPCS